MFAEEGYFNNLKATEVQTNSYPNARITINEGGSTIGATGNNAILGYAENASSPNGWGIKISGTALTDAFNMSQSSTWGNSSSMTYHYNEQNDTTANVYDNIKSSGSAYSSSLSFSLGTSRTILVTNGPSLSWNISENGTPVTIHESSGLFLPEFDLVLIQKNGNSYRQYATIGHYS